MEDSKYFEEKFKRVYDKLDAIDSRIRESNTKIVEHDGRLSLLEKEDLRHYNTCPNTKALQEMSKDLEEYRMLKKYPKIALYLGALVLFQVAIYIMDKLNVF